MMVEHEKIFVVFSYGDPMPITACKTPELAELYCKGLQELPNNHPLHTKEPIVEELPLLTELPEPFKYLEDND